MMYTRKSNPNSPAYINVTLDDGSLLVYERFVEPIGEEYDARGGLTVTQAQVLVEKWAKAEEKAKGPKR
ncbi:MAG: hypothetical protein KGL39_57925 [Patescibacteria group bacterium]|nr:hypothetical protein [Patescibacteria group bacterium]